MAPEERDSANARLEGGGNLSEAANRHLGLVVAGRLAPAKGSPWASTTRTPVVSPPGSVSPRAHRILRAGPSALESAPVAFPNRFSHDEVTEAPAAPVSEQAPRYPDTVASPGAAGADPGDLGRSVASDGAASSALAGSVAFAASAWPSPRPAPGLIPTATARRYFPAHPGRRLTPRRRHPAP